jgi:serine/threonine protein kinase
VLGSGSFGTVHSVQSSDVEVVKVFQDCTRTLSKNRSIWLRQELAAAQALPPHDHILRPIDVALDKANVQIIYPHCGMDLRKLLKQYGQDLWDEEQELIIQSLFRAVHHMHSNGLLHTDIKPSNILVEASVFCLSKTFACNSVFSPDICSRLVRLQSVMRVRLADLGSVQPAHSDDRLIPKNVDPNGLPISTTWYRAPELVLGDYNFSFPIDMWSLGCVLHELLEGAAMFPAKIGPGEVGDLVRLGFQMFGTPLPTGYLAKLPLFAKYRNL